MDPVTLLKRNNLYLKALIAGFSLLFCVLIGYVFIHNTYYFPDEDEGIYYNGARLFAETGSARAADCNDEAVSRIGHFDWYGPAYHVLYGSVAKIAGVHVYNFIIINLCCLALIIILILRSRLEIEAKLLILCSFLASYAFVAYTFTLYPEALELLFAVILTLQLHSIYTTTGPKNKGIAIYILLVILFSVFRVTTVFWAFGLLAFSVSAKDFFKKLTIAILSLALVFAYLSLFNAPAFSGGMAHIMHQKFSFSIIITLIKALSKTIYFFFTRNPFYDLIIVPLLVIAIYTWLINRNRFLLCACIISLIYFTVLLTFYVPYSFFFNKQTACLYPLLLIALFSIDTSNMKYLLVFVLIVFSPLTYLRAAGVVRAHKKIATENVSLKPLTEKLQQVRNNIKDGKPVVITTLYRDFDSEMPYTVFSGNVPVTTSDNYPILYSSRSGQPYDSSGGRYSSAFISLHRLFTDYYLSKYPIKLDSISLISSNDLFYLYKNNKKTK